jgi:hypothetical protein
MEIRTLPGSGALSVYSTRRQFYHHYNYDPVLKIKYPHQWPLFDSDIKQQHKSQFSYNCCTSDERLSIDNICWYFSIQVLIIELTGTAISDYGDDLQVTFKYLHSGENFLGAPSPHILLFQMSWDMRHRTKEN